MTDRPTLEDAVARVREFAAAINGYELVRKNVGITAADLAVILDEVESLQSVISDPVAVHLNMLRGGIAKPSPANIWHLYGDALARAMPAEFVGVAIVEVERLRARKPDDWCWAADDPEAVYSDPSEWSENLAWPLREPTIVKFGWGTSAGTTFALFTDDGEPACRQFNTLAEAEAARAALADRGGGDGR